ncbi:hypothetical protein [Peribacillus sp. NPDC097895]
MVQESRILQQSIEEGAKVIAVGSGKPKGLDGDFYVKSTIFADVKNEMTI